MKIADAYASKAAHRAMIGVLLVRCDSIEEGKEE